MFSYNTGFDYIEAQPLACAKGLSHEIADTAVADNNDGTVKLTLGAAHGLLAESVVFIEGLPGYNGLRKVTAVPSATTINILAPYTAIEPVGDGSETVKVAIAPGRPFKLLGIRGHFASGGATEESLVLTLDSHRGAAWDAVLATIAMASVTDLNWVFPEENNLPFHPSDIIRVAWDNTDTATAGIEILYQPLK